jgi:hypothetical protein
MTKINQNKKKRLIQKDEAFLISSKSVSRVLYHRMMTSIINLVLPLLTGLNNLPITTALITQDRGRAAPLS